MNTYKDLIVWQKAMNTCSKIYQITRVFPKEEDYILISQMRRASISIPSNISEGYGIQSTNEYKRFLKMSRGSVFELQTQLEIAFRNNYINKEGF